ncbi:MAG: hypothetical protein Q8Q06_04040, partial [bacterium]|nr:hypothetical protein [bacterium]
FYQQLGRGLRKLPGKKKVLVLDFVANCERVELIHELVEEVKKKTPRKPKRPRKPEKEIVLRSGNFRFTEKARDILNILKAKRSGYTREILIKQLQDLAIKLGRTPNETDIGGANKRGECASSVVFQKHLGHGSLIVAQKTAGLEPTRPDYTGYTKIKLIKEYQSLAKELGRVPCWHDLEKASKDGKCARPRIFYKYFDGKIKKLRKAARLEPDKELIKQLQGLAKELGRTPNKTDIGEANKEGRCASLNTFKRFGRGKLSTAQKMAGLTPNGKNIPSKKTAIKQLQSLAKELGRTPDCNDIVMANQNGMCPSLYAFYKFGGIVAVRKSAKLKLNRKSYTEKVLIKQLQDLAKELGRTPNKTDIGEANKEGRCASLNTFKRFGRGKLSTAQKMTGLTPTKKRLFSRPR